MSYSLSSACHLCTKKKDCVDSTFIQAAISGIHSVNWSNGVQKSLHLGSGTIELKCTNFVDERKQTPE